VNELAVIAASSNAFGIEAYGHLRATGGNLAFSPAGLSIALTMTWAGARGETAAQMRRALYIDRPPATVLPLTRWLSDSLAAAGPVVVGIANRLFGDKSVSFSPSFLETASADAGAALEPVDFRGAPEAARAIINDWVALQTERRIQNLVPSGGVDEWTRLALVNALYFLGDWQSPFEAEGTQPRPFYLSATRSADVPTMRQCRHVLYARAEGGSAVDLAYKGGRFAMLLVLPDARDGIEALEQSLTQQALDGLVASLSMVEVDILLPRFVVDPAESIALADLLKAIGMPLAFDREHADFTGMADPADPREKLSIGNVFHKAFVKVDEKGTEAAAASVVMAMALGAAARSEPPIEFRADHPFLFFIRERQTGLVVFMGRVADPGER
jgi:serpin B